MELANKEHSTYVEGKRRGESFFADKQKTINTTYTTRTI